MNNSFFSFDYYKSIFKKYPKTIRVCDYKNHKNGIIVRHDIDFDIKLAYEFAKMEKNLNVNSTYYFLLTTDNYNILSLNNITMIKEIHKMGFEIGLHFDPSIYIDNGMGGGKINNMLKKEINIFENFLDIQIKSYSLHQPSIHNIYIEDNIISAYNKDIFNDDSYISDSCFNFRGKDPIKFLKKSREKLVQFLTHPLHFSIKGKVGYNDFLNYKINNFKENIFEAIKFNSTFKKEKDNYKIIIK